MRDRGRTTRSRRMRCGTLSRAQLGPTEPHILNLKVSGVLPPTTPKMPNLVENLLYQILQKFVPRKPKSRSVVPQEVVDEIVSYVHDTKTLLSCSLTCHLWYYAALPHLHYSIRITKTFEKGDPLPQEGLGPLLESHRLKLLPLVKRLEIMHYYLVFDRRLFGDIYHLRDCFSALKNLQELRIDNLVPSSFMPDIEQYFGHFPTLRSLTLKNPAASCRQLLCFIGHFPNLQDLALLRFDPAKRDEAESVLVPISKPPLCGRLKLRFCEMEFVDEITDLYGGLPFRCVAVDMPCVQSVLDKSQKTLEALESNDFSSENSLDRRGRTEFDDS
jgi:hypothetical protein